MELSKSVKFNVVIVIVDLLSKTVRKLSTLSEFELTIPIKVQVNPTVISFLQTLC